MAADVWTKAEKNFIRSLKCTTNKFEVPAKLVFTTHKNLSMRADQFSEYTVFIDEVPNYAFEIQRTKHDAAALTMAHITNIEMAGEAYIDPQRMSFAVASGLVKITDFGDGAVIYHLNPHHPFKRCVVMTAFARDTGFAVLEKMGMPIEFVSTKESNKVFNEYIKLLEFEVLDKLDIYNKDTDKTVKSLMKFVKNPSKSFIVSTANQHVSSDMIDIRTNKVGINSLADLNECLVVTQLNLGDFEKCKMIEVFGEEVANELEAGLAGSKILQSIFRGAIRNRKKMFVYFGSKISSSRMCGCLSRYNLS